jgi:hypothetical protein
MKGIVPVLGADPDNALEAPADLELLRPRARAAAELKRRGPASNVGQVAESLALSFCNGTPGRPNLKPAPAGTQNVNALSRGAILFDQGRARRA